MVSNGGEWVIGVRKMSSDEGRWVIGVREMSYDTSKWAARVREMFFDGGYGPTGAALGMYFPTFFLSSFLSLMKEKRAKENQAPTGGGEVGRVQEGAGVVLSDGGERVIEVRKMFLGGGYGVAGAALGRYFSTFSLSSFLSLMKEKRAKENQAPHRGRGSWPGTGRGRRCVFRNWPGTGRGGRCVSRSWPGTGWG